MKLIPTPTTHYYYVPEWLSMLIANLRDIGMISILTSQSREGEEYLFRASYGSVRAKEDVIPVWNTYPEAIQHQLQSLLPTDWRTLVNMAEEYSAGRGEKESLIVHSGILELLIARSVELFNAEFPDLLLEIHGNFELVGRLPEKGKLLIYGKVSRIEGEIGQELNIEHIDCPSFLSPEYKASFANNIWTIKKANVVVIRSRTCLGPE